MAITTTPRFGFKQYSAGSDPHPTRDEHNAMLALVEAQAARWGGADTSAARPAAGKAGTVYRDTTLSKTFLDTGSSWIDLAPIGGGGAGAAVLVAGAAQEGTAATAARSDHTHSIPLATGAAPGAMSAADKALLDAATASATAGTLVKLDSFGRAQFATPSAAADAANKGYVDTQIGTRAPSSHTHDATDINSGVLNSARLPAATTSAAGALSAADKAKLDGATANAIDNTLMARGLNGNVFIGTATSPGHAANKGYVDQQINTRAPLDHTHLWADITDKPTTFAPSTHTHAYSSLTGIPLTFAPSAHGHSWTEISGKPTTYAPSAHGHDWGDITGAPLTYAPSAHVHSGADITTGVVAAARLPVATGAAAGTMSAADKAKLDAATPNATASTVAMRDAAGALGVGTPTSGGHAARKDYVDNHVWDGSDITTGTISDARIANATSILDGLLAKADKAKLDAATSAPTAGTLALRNSAGRIQVADPGTDTAAATPKAYVDARAADASNLTTGTVSPNRLPYATATTAGAIRGSDQALLDSATGGAVENSLVLRGIGGRANIGDPITGVNIANKAYVDAQISALRAELTP